MRDRIFQGDIRQCYGCRACAQICPQQCIAMVADEEGFRFPEINSSACIDCGLCEKVCPVIPANRRQILHSPATETYAAWDTVQNSRMQSSSGGIFPVLATAVLNKKGVVYGCAWKNESLQAEHIRITDTGELFRLRGSKYVQSSTGLTFRQVQEDLKNGLTVLYSGTPCQIAGLKLYLRKDYPNLIAVDLICHGVPSPKMLSAYVDFIEKKKGKISDLKFRDKKKSGWRSYISWQTSDQKKHTEIVGLSPYMKGFFKACFNRESCYRCSFTVPDRTGDITVADYWGIRTAHPELSREEKYGISAILVNTLHGSKFLRENGKTLSLIPSTLQKVAQHQPSLSHPDPRPQVRNTIFRDLDIHGFDYLARHELRPEFYLVRKYMPSWIKNLIGRIKK